MLHHLESGKEHVHAHYRSNSVKYFPSIIGELTRNMSFRKCLFKKIKLGTSYS